MLREIDLKVLQDLNVNDVVENNVFRVVCINYADEKAYQVYFKLESFLPDREEWLGCANSPYDASTIMSATIKGIEFARTHKEQVKAETEDCKVIFSKIKEIR